MATNLSRSALFSASKALHLAMSSALVAFCLGPQDSR